MKFPVYLDYNATTPCDGRVVEAMLPFFTKHFGNAASRSHAYGWVAEEGVEYAREQVGQLVCAEPKEIIFTSGATEADNLALKGVFQLYAGKGNHIITVSTEHKAVLDTCMSIEKEGGEVTYLQVKPDGLLDLDALEAAVRPTTILIAVMYANNETGTIQPVKQIGEIAKKHGIIFFSDATQAVGKIPVNVIEDQIDLMAFSAHKIYGPKGVGALYVRRKQPRVKLIPQMHGGGHEKGTRSGTLNVPGIVGFGKACDLAMKEMDTDIKRLIILRNKLENELLKTAGAAVNGSILHRLPYVCNLSFRYIDGNALMIGLNKSIAVSSGSACTSASAEPSHVLKALGLEDDLAHSSLRFSLGRFTTEEEVDFAIEHVSKTVKKLRESIII
ncbi:MAG TPA: IscS subfamily cysteine desulfurase [Flavitalea sp.]|nr:IscS subfamily cysteine desulfurase [Flavitalea sp.]